MYILYTIVKWVQFRWSGRRKVILFTQVQILLVTSFALCEPIAGEAVSRGEYLPCLAEGGILGYMQKNIYYICYPSYKFVIKMNTLLKLKDEFFSKFQLIHSQQGCIFFHVMEV